MKKITLFSMASCAHCQIAKQYFEQQKINFGLCNVKTPAGQKEFKRSGFRSVPVIKIGDQYLQGFNVKSFNKLYRN